MSREIRPRLVVLPLALALSNDIRGLAAAAVITQTLVASNRLRSGCA